MLARALLLLAMLAAAPALLPSAQAQQGLAAPKGPVILEVVGKIAATNAGNRATFDLAMLEAMETRGIETATPWTQGRRKFEGVPVKALLAAVGATGAKVRAVALNDYGVDIPAADLVERGAILAYRMDGKTLSVREKGPLWIIYPFDSVSGLWTDLYFTRSIWQLRSLRIE
ncbi:MAG: molybdopterin-dependent oxidoreductase [Alphaproteobacteria bacterium]|nr:molybdopterin-dependent oxidoreductase [Alphaproteobacteria bacterium]